jgi:hypothetical protein
LFFKDTTRQSGYRGTDKEVYRYASLF